VINNQDNLTAQAGTITGQPASQAPPMSDVREPRGVSLLDWKAVRQNTLYGFASVKVARINLRIDDVAIHQKGGSRWAALPSKPMVDRSGAVLRDQTTGKVKYSPILQWCDRRTSDAFSQAVVTALLAAHPDALDDGGAP
jgi:hypothetical protein